MCELSDLHSGQTAEWDDAALGVRVAGKIEHVSLSTGWVTLKLTGTSTPRHRLAEGDGTLKLDHITHTTLRAAWLTPRD